MFDGAEVANFSNVAWYRQYATVAKQIQRNNGCADVRDPTQEPGYYAAENQAQTMLDQQGIFSRDAFVDALIKFVDLSIDDALQSPHPLIQGFAMLDRRLGKRRLRAFSTDQLEHPFVRLLHSIRCEAEGIGDDCYRNATTENQQK